MPPDRPILIATRGSALALAQAHTVFDLCRAAFPRLRFEIKIIKTTGDKLQTAALAGSEGLPKGLFTKELEVALLRGKADLAVHSLKDLPTDLPAGLVLGAVGARADARDVLIYRDAGFLARRAALDQVTEWTPGQAALRGFAPGTGLDQLPEGAVLATSSTRRKAQALASAPQIRVVEIRGNVTTRLQKLAEKEDLDATLLACAGLHRLHFEISPDGHLRGDAVPDGLLATILPVEVMLPCVGQAAIGIEIRAGDERVVEVCQRLNHYNSAQCVLAERAFLHAMGGGCLSPVAAFADVQGESLRLRAVSFREGPRKYAEGTRNIREAEALGQDLAARLA